MLSMPAYGMTGPYRDFPGYGNTIEPVAGITNLVGYPGDKPHPLGMIAGDVLAALHGVSAIMVALHHRRQTGKGQYIDLSQAETQTAIIGDVVVGYSMNRASPPRTGNRHPYMAPHGCYRCKGDDSWVAVAVGSDEEWRSFCGALGNPPWTQDTRFADLPSRQQNHDELDTFIQAWTVQFDHYEVMRILQAAGVACGPVLNGREVMDDPHLNARGFFVKIPHPEAGTHCYAGIPVRLSKTPAVFRLPAPCLGEHNREMLGGLLGLTEEEIATLGKEGVTRAIPPEEP
jgi:crotonobetainyl-CoA:carnitine CoA-transferase CaiB-like acyl-CoA transferase